MGSRRARRQAFALIAAYAMVLQATGSAVLLSGTVARNPSFTVLCSHDGGGASPVDHDLPCAAVCAALSQATAGSPPPDIVVGVAEPLIRVMPGPRSEWTIAGSSVRGPQLPRGPPIA